MKYSQYLSNIIAGHVNEPHHRKRNLTRPVVRKQKWFLFWSQLIFFLRTFLPQWLPVISKKVCKWVLYHLVIKNYYRNLRIISLTLKICVSITFNIAVTMVRCTGSRLNSFCWISSLHFEKFQGSPSLQNFV